MRPRLVLLMVLGAALVPVVALGASSTKLTANMVGATEVPKGDPNGHATAAITITGP